MVVPAPGSRAASAVRRLRCAVGLDEAADLVNIQKAFIEAKIGTELEQRIAAIEFTLAKANLNLGIVAASWPMWAMQAVASAMVSDTGNLITLETSRGARGC